LRFGLVCLVVPLVIGCSSATPQKNDPLLGSTPVPVPKNAPEAKESRGVPDLPAPSASTSPAALAGAVVPQLDGGKDLRIGSDAGNRSGAPGVTLSRPQPIDSNSGPGARAEPVTPSAIIPAGGPAPITSIDAGLRLLEARGVKGFRLEYLRDSNQWRCSCSVASRQNPSSNVKQTFDARAADAVSAVRAVVEQVERDNR
jgi:hypothetical protein